MDVSSINQSSASDYYSQALNQIPEDSRSSASSCEQELKKDLDAVAAANQAAGAVGEDPSDSVAAPVTPSL